MNPRRMALLLYRQAGSLFRRLTPEHGNRFDLDEKIWPAEDRLDPGRRGQWLQLLLVIKCGSLFIESLVIALDIAQVASGTNDVVPGRAFGGKQLADIVERAAQLGAKIAWVHGAAGVVDACRPRDQKNGEA